MRSKVDAAPYVKVIVPRKAKVKTRLMYNCIASAKQALRSGGVSDASVTQKKNEARKRVPVKPSVDEQVGMIADIGVSSSKFKKTRLGLGGSESGLASLSALRAQRYRLQTLECKTVEVNSSGAHLAGLRDAVQEKLAALWDACLFIERLILDENLKLILQTDVFVAPEQETESVWANTHPATVNDVQMTCGIDKGGEPSSLKIVVGIMKSRSPIGCPTPFLRRSAPQIRTSMSRYV